MAPAQNVKIFYNKVFYALANNICFQKFYVQKI